MKNIFVFRLLAILALLLLGNGLASAQLYISEMFWDPAGDSLELTDEWVELRGDPNMDLTDHYLIFLENEPGGTDNAGTIIHLFDLGSLSTPKTGSNGFLLLLQGGTDYGSTPRTPINPASRSFVNTGTPFSWGQTGSSTVGWSAEAGKFEIDNSGFTAMVIRNDGDPNDAPYIPSGSLLDLDVDDDNELDPNGPLANWTILDSIGINASPEVDKCGDGMLYGAVNFSACTTTGPHVPAGAEYVDVGYEIENIARWGDSSGQTSDDWHVFNSTNDSLAGYSNQKDYRQSGDPHSILHTEDALDQLQDPNTPDPTQYVETNQGVPYGKIVTDSLGGPNFFVLDGDVNPTYNGDEYVFDGVVDGRDFLAIQRFFGSGVGLGPTSGFTPTRQHGDVNNDRKVDSADIAAWESNYGATLSTSSINTVPEPTSVLILMSGLSLISITRRR